MVVLTYPLSLLTQHSQHGKKEEEEEEGEGLLRLLLWTDLPLAI